MKNLSLIDSSSKSINTRFDAMHPTGIQFRTPEEAAPSKNKDPFWKRVDKALMRQITAETNFVLQLPDLDFSRK